MRTNVHTEPSKIPGEFRKISISSFDFISFVCKEYSPVVLTQEPGEGTSCDRPDNQVLRTGNVGLFRPNIGGE